MSDLPAPSTTQDPFRRPTRDSPQGEVRIRPLVLPDEVIEETDGLRFPLLIAALVSIAVFAGLASLRREAPVALSDRPLSAGERALLPVLIAIPMGTAGADSGTVPGAGFRIGRTEVTVEQFRIFLRHSGYTNPAWASFPCVGSADGLSWEQPGYEQAETYPVVCVSASDALAFATWMSKITGEAVRLPTEAEWEYAARGKSHGRYWWGDAYDSHFADCADCNSTAPEHPTYVGARPANDFGLLDVAGNVREWTCSAYVAGASASHRCAPELDEATNLVVLGGSWQEPQSALQLGARSPFGAWHRNVWTGFRIAAGGPG